MSAFGAAGEEHVEPELGDVLERALGRRVVDRDAGIVDEAEERVPVILVVAARRRQRLGRQERGLDGFLEFMLDMLLRALSRLSSNLRGKPETPDSRLSTARRVLGRRWFSRKQYLALFPRLSTATASRDIAKAVATGELAASGDRALTRYRFA